MPFHKSCFSKEDPLSHALVSAVLHAKGIVLICGAGISVAAGIPDFRSKQKIPGIPQLGKKKLKDMFQLSMLTQESQKPLFCQFIASLARKTDESEPTLFHELLRVLDRRGVLVRTYTQNIDGLEPKAGLSTYHRSSSRGDLRTDTCVPLHGDLQHVYCQLCNAVEPLSRHQEQLAGGSLPACSSCYHKQESRREAGLRVQTVPTMVPDVVLYGQEHPDADGIARFQTQDLSGARKVDLLLVVGTGMHILGTQRMIRDFAHTVRRDQPPDDPSPRVVYLNLDFRQRKKWEAIFDLWVQADCQAVARAVLDELSSVEGSPEQEVMVPSPRKGVDVRDESSQTSFDTERARGMARGSSGPEPHRDSFRRLLDFHMRRVLDLVHGNPMLTEAVELLWLAVEMVKDNWDSGKVVVCFHIRRVGSIGQGIEELGLHLEFLRECVDTCM